MFLGVPDPDPVVRRTDPDPALDHQAKIVRKTLIPTVLWLLYNFLSLKNYVNLASKSNKQKSIFSSVLKVTEEIAGSGAESGVGSRSVNQKYGSSDPDP
jgi:hypothetical protein